jgi:hypothetical protein
MENHPVIGSYILNRGRLKFRTAGAVLAQEALQAKSASRDFTVRLASTNRAVTGKVLNVELIESVEPAQWEIVMRV